MSVEIFVNKARFNSFVLFRYNANDSDIDFHPSIDNSKYKLIAEYIKKNSIHFDYEDFYELSNMSWVGASLFAVSFVAIIYNDSIC